MQYSKNHSVIAYYKIKKYKIFLNMLAVKIYTVQNANSC